MKINRIVYMLMVLPFLLHYSYATKIEMYSHASCIYYCAHGGLIKKHHNTISFVCMKKPEGHLWVELRQAGVGPAEKRCLLDGNHWVVMTLKSGSVRARFDVDFCKHEGVKQYTNFKCEGDYAKEEVKLYKGHFDPWTLAM